MSLTAATLKPATPTGGLTRTTAYEHDLTGIEPPVVNEPGDPQYRIKPYRWQITTLSERLVQKPGEPDHYVVTASGPKLNKDGRPHASHREAARYVPDEKLDGPRARTWHLPLTELPEQLRDRLLGPERLAEPLP